MKTKKIFLIPILIFGFFFINLKIIKGQNKTKKLLDKLEVLLFPEEAKDTTVKSYCPWVNDTIELTQNKVRPDFVNSKSILDSLWRIHFSQRDKNTYLEILRRFDNKYWNEWGIILPDRDLTIPFHTACLYRGSEFVGDPHEYSFLLDLEHLRYKIEMDGLGDETRNEKFINDLDFVRNREKLKSFYFGSAISFVPPPCGEILKSYFFQNKKTLKPKLLHTLSEFQPDRENEIADFRYLEFLLDLVFEYKDNNEELLLSKWDELKEYYYLNKIFIIKITEIDSSWIKKEIISYMLDLESIDDFSFVALCIIKAGHYYPVTAEEYNAISEKIKQVEKLRIKTKLPKLLVIKN